MSLRLWQLECYDTGRLPRLTCALIIPLHPMALLMPCPEELVRSSGKICALLDKEMNEALPLSVCWWRRGAVGSERGRQGMKSKCRQPWQVAWGHGASLSPPGHDSGHHGFQVGPEEALL